MDRAATGGSNALHLIGLVSDGGVHSHQRHLHALIEMAARRKVPQVFVHVITDGRDTSPTGAIRYVAELEDVMRRAGVGRIATVSGRYYAMDRDKRWERTKLAYDAVLSTVPAARSSTPTAPSALAAIQAAYDGGITDEFIKPIVIVDAEGAPVGPMRDGDSLIVFNFRADRARQITRALALGDDQFDGFRATQPAQPPHDDDDGLRPDVQPPGRLHAADVQQ